MNNKMTIPITSLMLLVSASLQAHQSLTLSSSALVDGGTLPAKFSCEGAGISPPFNWTGVPEGTQSLLLIMDHQPNQPPRSHSEDRKPPTAEHSVKRNGAEGLHWYWTLYNIPTEISAVSSGESAGIVGSNAVNKRNEYAPPCSKGPGLKSYTFHLYALAKVLDITASKPVSAALLRSSMVGSVLDADTLTVNFERSCQSPPPSSTKPASKPRVQGEQSEHQQPREDKQPPPPSTLPLCVRL